jgi:transcriptional regulator of heat shock response
MATLSRDVERMILQFFQGKDNEELKRIKNGRDVDDKLDEETVDEIKDQIWYLLKTQHIRWYYLADAIKDMVDHTQDEEDEQEQDEDTQSDPGW